MSQQKQNDDVIVIGGVGFILFLLAMVVWFVFRAQLMEVVRWVRVGELWAAKFVVGDAYYVDDPRMTVGGWRAWLSQAPISQVEPDHLGLAAQVSVLPLRKVFAAVLALLATITVFFGHGSHYRRRMGLETLMREQAKSFPAIFPFLKFDPRKQPARAPGAPVPAQLPAFAEALSPEEWIAYNEIPVTAGQVDYGRAYQALVKQLGRRWEGPHKLPLHAQGLYAACALKAARKRKDCEALLNEMAMSWSAEKGFRPSRKLKAHIRKTVKNPKLGGALRPFADQHAWEVTALLRCLSRARSEGGVLAPAEFLWLRGHDRALWYPLNNLGRKSYNSEAAGALVHYTNEMIANQKIPTPRVDEVIRGLETYLKSGGAREIPELQKKAKSK
jgi:intracellular multiplication protein IcmP